MAIEAISWVFSQDIRPSTSKFVLVALANYIQPDATAWCPIPIISGITSQDRKTVMRALADLEAQGYIKDTGNRKGHTGQIKVYEVRVPDAVLLKLPKESRVSSKQYRSSRQRVPHTVHDPYKLSVIDPKGGFQQKRCKCGAIATHHDICGVCHTKKTLLNN